MTDALERLKNQKRPQVKPRSDNLNTNDKKQLSTNVSMNINTNESGIVDTDELELVEVVRNSILLEKSLHNDLTEFCKDEKVIKAVWIEAAFRYLEEHPETMKEVVSDARERVESRKQSARYRQAKSFSQKLPKRS
jgi:hypothetical protein